jgi:hypothetical protein
MVREARLVPCYPRTISSDCSGGGGGSASNNNNNTKIGWGKKNAFYIIQSTLLSLYIWQSA